MNDCRENCIANVDGKCAVERCDGAISRTGRPTSGSVENAAKFYKASKEAFRYYFGEGGPQ